MTEGVNFDKIYVRNAPDITNKITLMNGKHVITINVDNDNMRALFNLALKHDTDIIFHTETVWRRWYDFIVKNDEKLAFLLNQARKNKAVLVEG